MPYDASAIQILDAEQVCQKFVWAKAGALAERYKKPLEWIERGLQACDRIGIDHSFFIEKYLDRKALPKHDGLSAALQDILKETR